MRLNIHFHLTAYIKQVLLLTMTAFVFTSCYHKSLLEIAMEKAEDNASELQKVLDQYSSPKDSLKKKAAVFLIENMIGKYYLEHSENKEATNFINKLSEIKLESHPMTHTVRDAICKQMIEESQITETYYEYEQHEDLSTIESDILIDHINYAFKAWELPWSKDYSFDQFCNYILPYRYASEKPVCWRSFFFNQLQPLREELKDIDDPIEASKKIITWIQHEYVWVSDLKEIYPRNGTVDPITLFKTKCTQHCLELSAQYMMIFQSLGIAALQVDELSPNRTHIEGAIVIPEGKMIHFHGIKNYPNELVKHGVHRYSHISFVSELNNKDISSQFMKTYEIHIKLNKLHKNGNVKLCTYAKKKGWVPIYQGRFKKNEIIFNNVRPNVLYVPFIENKNELNPIYEPVYFKNGIIDNEWRINSDSTENVIIDRKYIYSYFLLFKEKLLLGSKIQVADNPAFKNAKDIYHIDSLKSQYPNYIDINTIKTKYIRFLLPSTAGLDIYSSLAELEFGYKEVDTRKKMTGQFLYSKGLNNANVAILFDNNILSYQTIILHLDPIKYPMTNSIAINEAPDDSIWIGMDFGEMKEINYFMFCPRNDKNGIYPGMTYQLVYWDNKWIELETKRANKDYLEFSNVPTGKVLWLKNLDEGKEENPFYIKNGEYIWFGNQRD